MSKPLKVSEATSRVAVRVPGDGVDAVSMRALAAGLRKVWTSSAFALRDVRVAWWRDVVVFTVRTRYGPVRGNTPYDHRRAIAKVVDALRGWDDGITLLGVEVDEFSARQVADADRLPPAPSSESREDSSWTN